MIVGEYFIINEILLTAKYSLYIIIWVSPSSLMEFY